MEKGKIQTIIITVAAIFFSLFLYTKLAGPIPLFVNSINSNKSDLFEVQGSGKASGVPDEAVLNLGINATGTDALDTQKKANEIANRITAALKELGIPDKNIKTINYSLNPDFNTQGKASGFSINETLEARVPLDKANQAIDKSTSSGANLINGITFELNEKNRLNLENKARKEAVEKAKNKAKGLAGASGIRLGRIINVKEEQGGQPIIFDTAAKAETQPGSTSLNPGENNIEITVTLTYETF